MPPSAASLEKLPHETQHHILSFADELTVWRFSAISRGTRDAGRAALQSYLVSKTVTVKPPFVTNIFEVLDHAKLAAEDLTRRNALRRTSILFSSHLYAYPASASSLRQITLELRDDEDIAGWPHLARFAPALERLNIHHVDRLMMLVEKDLEFDPEQIHQRCANTADVFRRILDYGSIQFPQLKILSIASTSRIIEFFGGIAPTVRGITDLVLSSHWFVDPDDYEYDPTPLWDGEDPGTFPALERVTLTGDDTMSYVAREIIRSSPTINSLILHFTNFPTDSMDDFEVLLEEMASLQRPLKVLSVYGTRTGDCMRDLIGFRYGEDVVAGTGLFEHLKELYLQYEDLADGEGDQKHDNPYPLLSGGWSQRPRFPKLEIITWVDRNHAEHPLPSPDDPELKKLFDMYPTLRLARWMDDFPANPSMVDSPTYPYNGRVIQEIARPPKIEELPKEEEEVDM